MKYSLLFFSMFLNVSGVFAQQRLTAAQLSAKSDSLYLAKEYKAAAETYGQLAEAADFRSQKAAGLYNAACCLALAGDSSNAMLVLQNAVMYGYNNKAHLLEDSDLKSLHSNPMWDLTVALAKDKPAPNTNPAKTKFVTDDIHRFWKAYDLAQKDTANYKSIFESYYFSPATEGMDDYMTMKVSSINAFIAHIRSAPKFYGAIRENTFKVDTYKKDFKNSFKAFKKLYPAATFPDVYFVIGSFSSGGTVSDAGLLIGVNQMAQSEGIPVDELTFRQRTRSNKIDYLPAVIAHELIHFQQKGMKSDTTTLYYAIQEGMADFIGELISGHNSNPNLYVWAAGKEKVIWERFKADMYFNRYDNWIANSRQATPDNLPDQGYWIGYQICKAYYEKAADKKQAINYMLHLQDYPLFLRESGWEEKLSKMN